MYESEMDNNEPLQWAWAMAMVPHTSEHTHITKNTHMDIKNSNSNDVSTIQVDSAVDNAVLFGEKCDISVSLPCALYSTLL